MRRGLLGVAALVVLISAGFVLATLRHSHQLGAKLVDDLAAMRARRHPIPRAEGALPPRVENGAQCLASTLSVAPTDLKPFDDGKAELGAFVRGEKPLSELPEEAKSKLETLRPWVKAVRECSDAAQVTLVDDFAPWASNDRSPMKLMAAARHVGIDTRTQLEAGLTGDALETCTSMMEVALDVSHFSLLHSMTATAVVKMVAPTCSAAWKAADERVRAQFSPRWVLLGARFSNDHDILESERLTMSLMLFGSLAGDEAGAKLPNIGSSWFELTRGERVVLARLWPDWDAAMRQTVDANDPASRAAAADAMLAVSNKWWVPAQFNSFGPGYAKFLERLDQTREALTALASLATNGKTPMPPGVKVNDGVLDLRDDVK